MKKILLSLLIFMTFSIVFINVKAETLVEVDAGGTWTYEIFETSLLNWQDIILFTYQTKIPDGATDFEFWSAPMYLDYIEYSWYDLNTLTSFDTFGAYWINYETDDIIGNYDIEDVTDLNTYLDSNGGYNNLLHFEYDISALIISDDWTEDYTFVCTFTLNAHDWLEEESRSQNDSDSLASEIMYYHQTIMDSHYIIDIELYNYFTLNFYGFGNTLLYSQPYSDVEGVYDFNITSVPDVPIPFSIYVIYEQTGWRYKDNTAVDVEDIDTDKAINNVIDIYATWTTTVIDTTSTPDTPINEITPQDWFVILMTDIHLNTSIGYMLVFLIITILIIVGLSAFKSGAVKKIIPLVILVWLILATWIGMLPLFAVVIFLLLLLVIVLTQSRNSGGGVVE